MSKTINASNTVYDICKEDPAIIEIMKELGFDQITQPGMLNTAGRFMTLTKGAAMKGISIEKIRDAFAEKGYTILQS